MEPIQEHNLEQNQQSMSGTVVPRLTFGQAIKEAFSKYATFQGRSRRSEYWWFSLFLTLLALVFFLPVILVSLWYSSEGIDVYETDMWPVVLSGLWALLGSLVFLALLIPSLTVQVRRLHDVGRSGWWLVGCLVASIVFEILAFCLLGTRYSDMIPLQEYREAFAVSTFGGVALSLLGLINTFISIALIVFSLFDSHKGVNKYGPSPKYL